MSKDNQTNAVTIRELYTLIDSTKREIMRTIERVEVKFDTMEAGRLTAAEKEIANMQGRMMMVPSIISIAISIFFFLINYIITRFT